MILSLHLAFMATKKGDPERRGETPRVTVENIDSFKGDPTKERPIGMSLPRAVSCNPIDLETEHNAVLKSGWASSIMGPPAWEDGTRERGTRP